METTETEANVETLEVMPGADVMEASEPLDMNFGLGVEEELVPESAEEAEELVPESAELEAEAEVEEEEVEAELAEPEPEPQAKKPMVPKARLDEVLAKQKALQKQLDDIRAENEPAADAPEEFDFNSKELEYQQLVLDGEADKATMLRQDIRKAERQQIATYDAGTDITTFVLPYTPGDKAVAVTRFTGASKEGLWLGESETNTIVCTEKGDWTGENVGFGEPYQFKYVFSNGYLPTKDQSKQKIVGELDGRTQILRWHVYHHQTGAYDVRVKRKSRAKDTIYNFRARFLNTLNNKLDTEESFVESGSVQVPVCTKNTESVVSVESDSWLPCVLSGAAWEGSYNDRARGV